MRYLTFSSAFVKQMQKRNLSEENIEMKDLQKKLKNIRRNKFNLQRKRQKLKTFLFL